MALINLRQFKGEVPSVEPHLLPASAGQFAQNCEFSTGALRSRRGGSLVATMANNPVRGIFTIDGINFYTWDADTIAFQGPILGDVYNRMYFLRLSEGVLRVASTLGAAPNGPSPAASWRAGVPRPTAAPTLMLINRTTLPDYPNAVVKFQTWFESGGKVYSRVEEAVYTALDPFKRYQVAPPPRDAGTPAEATVAVKMIITNEGAEISSVTMRGANAVRNNAFPGTQEYSLTDGNPMLVNITWGPEETRAYVYTYQNDWREEGGPSPAALISPTYLQDVDLQMFYGDFSGFRPLQGFNVYRTYGSNAAYIGVGYSVVGDARVRDQSRTASMVLGALESTEWDPFPTGLQGVEVLPSGIVAAFVGKELYVSDPYRPHGAPYIFSFSKSIRGICAAQQSLVITTADGLYILAGSNPASAKPIKLNLPQPGIAQRSMVNVDGGTVYASNDGIAMVEGSAAGMDTSHRLFGREKWRAMYGPILDDASMRFAFQDGRLIASSHTRALGFVLRFDEDAGSLCRTTERYDSMFRLPSQDALYYSVGNQIWQFQGGSELEFVWQSKDFIFAKGETFGAGLLRGSPVTMTLIADGAQVYEAVIGPGHFRLPSLPYCLRMSVRLRGTGHVEELILGRTMQELKNV